MTNLTFATLVLWLYAKEKARSQMLPTKVNMKGNQTDVTCRLCKDKDTQEMQKHILQDCPVMKEKNLNIEYDEIF